MVCIEDKLEKIKNMVDAGSYFVINRARQYGKTTTLKLLADYLKNEYIVISLDFQKLSNAGFQNEHIFSTTFTDYLIRTIESKKNPIHGLDKHVLELLQKTSKEDDTFSLTSLFVHLSTLCDTAEKPIVLIIDEVDSATNNQVFLDFLSQLRGYYLDREDTPAFQSVILAGVYDIKNLKNKIRPEEDHKFNSPWNIAEPFLVDMSLSETGIAGMLSEYELEHLTGMNISDVAHEIYAYTSGYPFLVSLICRTLDTTISLTNERLKGDKAWSVSGVSEAIKIILREKSPIFDSMIRQISEHKELKEMLHMTLFTGSKLAFNPDDTACELGVMFGYIKDDNGIISITNRIFETRLYNYFLSEVQLNNSSYLAASNDKNQFIVNGMLDMDLIIEKFVTHFHDVYGDNDQKFIENYGRKFFLLYLKPIINGTGNYYIESQTRDAKRTDIIVDYLGKRFIIELKIWNGQKYNEEGERQIIGYLDRYHLEKGYLLSFSFNKNKEIGVKEITYANKTIIEAIV